MAKRGKKSSGFKKFAITCVVLIAAQVTFISLYSSAPVELKPRDAVNAAMKTTGELPDGRKESMRIQMALADYRSRKGEFPKTLNALVPEYFDTLPLDPDTGKPITYTLTNGRYHLGISSAAKAPGTGVVEDLKIDPVLLASLDNDNSERASFVYDPTGKRDPFLPFDLTEKNSAGSGTELEQYAIGQLRYTSYLGGAGEPIAIVENSLNRGFTVRRGTKIGTNGGTVVEIQPTKILVLETTLDPITNEKKNTTVEMELRSAVKTDDPRKKRK